jgi:alanine racemase
LTNTSGIINYPDAHYDMVRSGIGLYGYGNQSGTNAQLLPIATLKTVISQLHSIGPGESVGYNNGFIAEKNCTIATLPLGHADGIGRHYGQGRGSVIINGSKAPVIGNVCMDMMMVDTSGISCSEGDEVIVFGRDNRADTLAEAAGTISYELLTGISQRVKRIIVNN